MIDPWFVRLGFLIKSRNTLRLLAESPISLIQCCRPTAILMSKALLPNTAGCLPRHITLLLPIPRKMDALQSPPSPLHAYSQNQLTRCWDTSLAVSISGAEVNATYCLISSIFASERSASKTSRHLVTAFRCTPSDIFYIVELDKHYEKVLSIHGDWIFISNKSGGKEEDYEESSSPLFVHWLIKSHQRLWPSHRTIFSNIKTWYLHLCCPHT